MEIMIVAGEASGDAHAAELIQALRRRHPQVSFFGCGGERMAAAGCELLVSTRDLAVMGLFEVVRHLPRLRNRLRRLRRALAERKPAGIILVDFPDFNLRLAAAAQRAGVRAVYFISPQLWAWRSGRVKLIRRYIRRMICIFPFEPAFYARHGIDVADVGHPLVERIEQARTTLPGEADFRARHGMDATSEIIALLPGSRKRELDMHLDTMLEAARRLHAERHVEFVLPVGAAVSPAEVEAALPPPLRPYVHLAPAGDAYAALAHARLAIVASGTATLEAALWGAPMIVVYRLSAWSYRLGRRLVHVPYVAMVNLIAGKAAVPELIQADFEPGAIVAWARRLLEAGAERSRMEADLAEVRVRLGSPGAIDRAAREVEEALLAQP
jgi:lipid-A-disaccharide synthase